MDKSETLSLKCPRCGDPAPWWDNPWRPFCSQRCRQIDLGSWVDEEYRLPAEDSMSEELV